MAMIPPFAAGVGLIPPGADARFAGPAVAEEHREFARTGPVHLRLPLVGPQTAATDVVLDDFGGVLAFQVAHLAVDEQVFLAVHRFQAHRAQWCSTGRSPSQGHGRLDVGVAGRSKKAGATAPRTMATRQNRREGFSMKEPKK